MKKLTITCMTMLLVMGLPMLALSASHGDHDMHKGHEMNMDHAKEKAHDMHAGHDMHKGHDMSGDDFVEAGKDTQDGVVATVKVKAYDEETVDKMKAMGMAATHHVMVFFADEKSGDAIVAGKAALKVKGSGDDSAKPAMLMLMGNGFGTDVNLQGMMITFEVGTKLEDGKKRQFEVSYHNM
jgi:hypothetical protein